MKKLVIASAVAAVMASGAAAADATLGGEVRLKLQSKGDMALNSGKLTVKLSGSEDLGNGMTAGAYVEMENDSADNEANQFHNDKSFVYLKGDFGQLALGAQGDAAGFACGGTDIFTDNTGNACNVGATNGTLDNAVTYVKGAGAVTFVLGLTFDGDLGSDDLNMVDNGAAIAAAAAAADAATTPAEAAAAAEALADAIGETQPAPGNHSVVAVNFDGGMFTVGAQITSPDSELDIDDWMVVGGTVKLGEGTLGWTFADNGADDNSTATAVAYAMPLAGGTIKVGMDMGEAMENADGDDTVTNIEFEKGMGKSAYWGVQFSNDDREDDALAQGYMGYNF